MADHKLIFGGADSSTYGIYISGEGVFNAPERAVEMISIPGRNGAIALDQGRFENIEVTYPAFNYEQGMSDFSSNLAGLRSALCSKSGYQRLTDTIHPDEFRLGVYRSGLEVTPVKYNTASDFNITFDCKPQRFLTSGETEVDGNAWSNVQTGSGSIVTIDNAGGEAGIKSLVANIEPIQSGSGTPSPTNVRPISGWDSVKISKAGKNIAESGYAWNIDANGKIISNTGYNCSVVRVANGQTYTHSRNGVKANIDVVAYYSEMPAVGSISYNNSRSVSINGTFTAPIDGYAVIRSGSTVQNIQVESGSTATSYEPYNEQVYTNALGRTVYGGTLDLVSGVLAVTKGYIASYNGETLTSTWISDRDVYASGTTPTTGAQVVYQLATPQTYQLTPEEVDLLLGANNIWADSGDITVQYGNSPVYNPTEFDAKPLIKVVGIGTAVVGDTAITITGTAGQTIYIDCDSMEIYTLNGGTPQSAASLVSFSGNDFPKLKAGSNTVALGTGITSVTITPRWWII